jgi:hypothetical protein
MPEYGRALALSLQEGTTMSDHSSDRSHGPARQFVPDVTLLEDRQLLSTTVTFPDGHTFVVPDIQLPRTGGVAVQTGAALRIGVADNPSFSTLQITTDGAGNVVTRWDNGAVHVFHGVRAIVASVGGRATDLVHIDMTGPLTRSLDVSITLNGVFNVVAENVRREGPAIPLIILGYGSPGPHHTQVTKG